jgi:hypothetical protein
MVILQERAWEAYGFTWREAITDVLNHSAFSFVAGVAWRHTAVRCYEQKIKVNYVLLQTANKDKKTHQMRTSTYTFTDPSHLDKIRIEGFNTLKPRRRRPS